MNYYVFSIFFPLASTLSYDWEEKHKMLLGLVKQNTKKPPPPPPAPPEKNPKNSPTKKSTQEKEVTFIKIRLSKETSKMYPINHPVFSNTTFMFMKVTVV